MSLRREILPLSEDFYKEYCIPMFGLKVSWNGQAPIETTVPNYPLGHALAGQTRNGIYGYNNGTFSFVNENGLLFICPYRDNISDVLKTAGYLQEYIYVPLSNGEEIVNNELMLAKYNWLRAQQREYNKKRA